jgi:hypothetical protein
VDCGTVTFFVPDDARIAPEWVPSAVAAATDPDTHGLYAWPPLPVLSDASTKDSHLSLARSPAYVTIAIFATCGRRFVAGARLVLVITRCGYDVLYVPYEKLVTFDKVSRMPESDHVADVVPSDAVKHNAYVNAVLSAVVLISTTLVELAACREPVWAVSGSAAAIDPVAHGNELPRLLSTRLTHLLSRRVPV